MTDKNEVSRCRHNGTWLICGGYGEWCYECGALRRMQVVNRNEVRAETQWCRPTGIGGANPYPMKELRKCQTK